MNFYKKAYKPSTLPAKPAAPLDHNDNHNTPNGKHQIANGKADQDQISVYYGPDYSCSKLLNAPVSAIYDLVLIMKGHAISVNLHHRS